MSFTNTNNSFPIVIKLNSIRSWNFDWLERKITNRKEYSVTIDGNDAKRLFFLSDETHETKHCL